MTASRARTVELNKFDCRLAEEITVAEKALHLAIEHRDALNYTQLTGYMQDVEK